MTAKTPLFLVIILLGSLSCHRSPIKGNQNPRGRVTPSVIDSLSIVEISLGGDSNKVVLGTAIDSISPYLLLSYTHIDFGFQDGYEIWNFQTRELVYEVQFDSSDPVIEPPDLENDGRFIQINVAHPNSDNGANTLHLFELSKGRLYRRHFTTKEWQEVSIAWFKKYHSFSDLFADFEFEEVKLY